MKCRLFSFEISYVLLSTYVFFRIYVIVCNIFLGLYYSLQLNQTDRVHFRTSIKSPKVQNLML